MKSLLNQTYAWALQLAKSRYNLLFIFLFFFLDASIFPFPTTIIFITISLLHPSQSYYNAALAAIGMTTGSLVGYAFGNYMWLLPNGEFTAFAQYLFLHVPGLTIVNYHVIQSLYLKWGYSLLCFSTIVPLPYQFFSIAAGVFKFNIYTFTLVTLLVQSIRFFIVAWLILKYGEGVRAIFQKNLKFIAASALFILFILFLYNLLT